MKLCVGEGVVLRLLIGASTSSSLHRGPENCGLNQAQESKDQMEKKLLVVLMPDCCSSRAQMLTGEEDERRRCWLSKPKPGF